MPYIFYKTLLVLSIFSNRCGSNDEKIFKTKETTKILEILGLINTG